MNISSHFTLDELTITAHRGIDNDPPMAILAALKRTAQGLERVRDRLGGWPIIINSGYRSPALNAAVGGAANSQHMLGEAADFICPKFGKPLDIVYALRDSPEIEFDQLIAEWTTNGNGGWAHISFSAGRPRGQTLMIDGRGTRSLP